MSSSSAYEQLVPGLSERQLEGLACVICAVDFDTVAVAAKSVDFGPRGQLFACSERISVAIRAGRPVDPTETCATEYRRRTGVSVRVT